MNEVPGKLNQHLTFIVDEKDFAVFEIDETIKSIREKRSVYSIF